MQIRVIPFSLVIASVSVASALYCETIRQKYSPPERHVTQHGMIKNITLYYDNDLGRAAAYLLQGVLQYALGYQDVQLRETPDRISGKKPCMKNETFKEVTITISVPSQLRLHLHLAKPFRNREVCANIVDWESYSNSVTASECGFEGSLTSEHIFTVTDQSNSDKSEVETFCSKVSSMPFRFKNLNRTDLFEMIRSGNRSFLFIDYDIWAENVDVSRAELPPYLEGLYCLRKQNLEAVANATTTVSDDCLIEEYAPQLYKISSEYAPSLTNLRPVLERTSSGKEEMETICKCVAENYTIVDTLVAKYKPSKKKYTIISIVCDNFPGLGGMKFYDQLLTYLGNSRYKNNNSNFNIIVQSFEVDCLNADGVLEDLNQLMSYDIMPSLIGIVIANVLNVEKIMKIMNKYNVPILLYDASNVDVATIKTIVADKFPSDKAFTTPMWITAGRSLHLTLALQHFIHSMSWTRVALISETSLSAIDFRDQLINLGGLILREYRVRQNITELEVERVVQKINNESGRIIVVNTDYKYAEKILLAAVKLKMNVVKNYAWLLREWKPSKQNKLNITHFVLSFWCKDSKDVLSNEGQMDHRRNLDILSPYLFWPPLAAALGNALLTLVTGFDDVLLKYPQARDDTQSRLVIRQFERSLAEVPVRGITQTLKYKMRMLEEAMVFLEQWHAGKRILIMQMRVNSTSHTVKVDHKRQPYDGIAPPDDFASKCILQNGDPYEPKCYNILQVMIPASWLLIILITCIHRWRRKKQCTTQ